MLFKIIQSHTVLAVIVVRSWSPGKIDDPTASEKRNLKMRKTVTTAIFQFVVTFQKKKYILKFHREFYSYLFDGYRIRRFLEHSSSCAHGLRYLIICLKKCIYFEELSRKRVLQWRTCYPWCMTSVQLR